MLIFRSFARRSLPRLAGDREELVAIDRLAGALRIPRELRQASLQTGRRRLAILIRLRPTPELKALQPDRRGKSFGRTSRRRLGGLLCFTFPRSALGGLLLSFCFCLCTAAPKLIRIGQEGTQRVLTACLDDAKRSVAKPSRSRLRLVGLIRSLDIAAMRHEIADERLFIS